MGSNAPLQGQISFQRTIADPEFHTLPQADKLPVLETVDPEFAALPDDDKIGVIERLSPAPQPKNQGSWLDLIPGAMAGLADTGSYITQPVEKLLNTGVNRYDVTKEAAYQYNPSFKFGADAGKFIGDMAGYGVSALGGLPGVAAYSANKNIQQVAGGEQNIGQAVFNTALDPLMGKFGPQSRGMLGAIGKNAAIGGVGGAASYAGNTALTGQQFDPQALLQSVLQGGATGGALGGGMHAAQKKPFFAPKQSATPINRQTVQSRGVNQALEKGSIPYGGDRLSTLAKSPDGRIYSPAAAELRGYVQATRKRALESQAATEQKTFQDRLTALNKLFKDLDGIERDAQPVVSANARIAKERIKAEYNRVLAEKEAKFPSKKPQKQERAQAAEKESAKRKADTVKAKAKERGEEPAQSLEGKVKYLRQAHEKGETILNEYEAQGGKSGKGGESLDNTYRYKYDTVIEAPSFNKQGVAQVKVINEQGQIRTRLLNEPESGSRIVSVTKTGEPARFKFEDGQVIEVATGKVIEQVKTEGRFSSEIRADIDKIENFDRAMRKYKQKKARVGDIVKASRDLDDVSLEKQLDEKNPKVYEDTTGEPC